MQVEHPLAGDGDGRPPSNVDVDGDSVAVDDNGRFEIPEERSGWLRRFAEGYDVEPDALVYEADGPPDDVEAPFDPSDLTVDELKSELEDAPVELSDEDLDALAAAEAAGEDRDTALDAIDAQREE